MFRASEASCGEENGRKKETAHRVRTVKLYVLHLSCSFVASANLQGIVHAVSVASFILV
jgi:hypothetical protein